MCHITKQKKPEPTLFSRELQCCAIPLVGTQKNPDAVVVKKNVSLKNFSSNQTNFRARWPVGKACSIFGKVTRCAIVVFALQPTPSDHLLFLPCRVHLLDFQTLTPRCNTSTYTSIHQHNGVINIPKHELTTSTTRRSSTHQHVNTSIIINNTSHHQHIQHINSSTQSPTQSSTDHHNSQDQHINPSAHQHNVIYTITTHQHTSTHLNTQLVVNINAPAHQRINTRKLTHHHIINTRKLTPPYQHHINASTHHLSTSTLEG
jgi:hypothetical protein